MSCNNCTVKNIKLFFDVESNTFAPENISFGGNIYDYVMSVDDAVYGVWYPAFIYPDQNNYLGLSNYISTDYVSLKSFDVTGKLKGFVPWNLNIFGEADENNFYSEGILFWYRYWDPNVYDKYDNTGLQIFVSNGDFVVHNGEPKVTPNLQSSADIIKNLILKYPDDNFCDADYISKVLASGPQIDMITEVLTGSAENCFVSDNEDDHYYAKDSYARIIQLLVKMSNIQYSSVTTNKFVSTVNQLVIQLVSKYGFYVGSNEFFSLTSKFYSESGPNIAIKAAPSKLIGTNKDTVKTYGLKYKVGNLTFTANNTMGTIRPTDIIDGVAIESNKRYIYKELLLNNFLIGYYLLTEEEEWPGLLGYVKFHGLGGVSISGAPDAADGTGMPFEYGSIYIMRLISGGSGYVTPPTIRIQGGGGTGFQAKAILGPRSIGSVRVINQGFGYFSPPTVYIYGGGGFGAKAEAVVNDLGNVTAINITEGGQGYTSTPQIRIVGCGDFASAEVEMQNDGFVESIEIINYGRGYYYTKNDPDNYPKVVFNGGGSRDNNFEPTSEATAAIGEPTGQYVNFGDEGTNPNDNGVSRSWEVEDLPNLGNAIIGGRASEDNPYDGDYCTGEQHSLPNIFMGNNGGEFSEGLPVAKMTGNFAGGALYINGDIYCADLDGHNDKIPCVTSIPRTVMIDMSTSTNLSERGIRDISIKHNIGDRVSASNVRIFYGGVRGPYRHLRDINEKPFFIPYYNDGINHESTQSIDANRSKITLEYYPGPETTIFLEEIDIRYLRSSLNPGCESFITGGGISTISVIDGGQDYWGTVFVQIIGGGGTGASAEAVVNNGSIEAINITNPGSGFTSSPMVSVIDSSGMGDGARFLASTTHTTVLDDPECQSITESLPQPQPLPGLGTTNRNVTHTPATSTYYVPDVWAYGGLSAEQVIENGVSIVSPIDGTQYHQNPGQKLPKNHRSQIEEPNGGCTIEYEGCNTDTVVVQIPYSANISAQLIEGADHQSFKSVKFAMSWNNITVNQSLSPTEPIGILKTLAQPTAVHFYVEVPGGEPFIDEDTGQSTMPEKKWTLRVTATKNDYEDVVLPMAPSMQGTKGFFHPNKGFIYDNKYLNKTAVILNHRPNSRPGKYLYDYHTGVLHDDNFQPGYNYMFDFNNISSSKAATLLQSKYIGIPIGTGSYFVSNEVYFRQYLPNTSPLLKPAKFDFINLDTYLYTGGTLLNDFSYQRIGDYSIRVSSVQGENRVIQYLNNMPDRIEENAKLILYNGINTNRYEVLETTSIDKNIVYFSKKVPFGSGFISKPIGDDDSIESVLVYRPRDVFNDPYHETGKWGHLSYGEAAIEGLSWYDYRRFNLITLKTMLSTDSAMTWSSPIIFHNNFNSNNKTLYQPLTNKWMNDQRVDNYFTLSQYDANFDSRFPSSDLILSYMVINGTRDYIYIGPYTGYLNIRLGIAGAGNISSGEQFFVKVKIGEDELEFEVEPGSYMDFPMEKTQQEPLYAQVEVRKVGEQCVGVQTTNVSSATPIITYASVKIDNSAYNVRRTSIISFYKHKIRSDSKEITQDQSVLGPASTVCGHKVSPLEKIPQLFDRSIDFSSLMDMHIFSDPNLPEYRPIRSIAGNVYFEDFLEPVSKGVFDNAGYDQDKFWINIPRDINWKFMSSKGYVFEEGKIYKVLINLRYDCTDSAYKCAGIYKVNICNQEYVLTIEQMLNLLGITGGDQQYFDSQVITFPGGCSSIDFCCASRYVPGSWSYNNCVEQEQQRRQECSNFFTKDGYEAEEVDCTNIFGENSPPETNPSCDEDPDPDDPEEVGGTIYPATSSFLYFKVKNNIRPFLDATNSGQFLFLPEATQSNLACSNAVIPSLGSVFKYNYFCTTLNDKCDFIIERDFTSGKQFVPGSLLDPSQLFINQLKGQGSLGEPPLDLLYKNEQAFRNIISPNLPVAAPLAAEYDRYSHINYKYKHRFTIHLDQMCPTVGPLFEVFYESPYYEGIHCKFFITQDPTPLLTAGSLRLESPCFGSHLILEIEPWEEDDPEAVVKYVNVREVQGDFSCVEHGLVDTFKDFDPLEHLEEGDELLSSHIHETYREQLSCHYCGEQNCNASYSYTEASPEECHCPAYAELTQDVDGTNICSFPQAKIEYSIKYYGYDSNEKTCVAYDNKSEYVTCGCGYSWYDSYGGEGLCTEPANCFCEILAAGSTERCGDGSAAYEEACPNANSTISYSTTRTEHMSISNETTSPAEKYAALIMAEQAANKAQTEANSLCHCRYSGCSHENRHNGMAALCGCQGAYESCLTCCQTYIRSYDIIDTCGNEGISTYCRGWGYYWWGGWYGGYSCPSSANCASHEPLEEQVCRSVEGVEPGGIACYSSAGSCTSRYWDGTTCQYTSEPCEIPCPFQLHQKYTTDLSFKTRVITTVYNQKSNQLSFEEIKEGTETIKIIDHVMAIRYIPADFDEGDGEPNPNPVPLVDCPCPIPLRLDNLTITFTQFKNFVQIDGAASDWEESKQICIPYGGYNDMGIPYAPFHCPHVGFKKYNPNVFMSDSISTQVSSCYAGWAGVLEQDEEG